MTNENSTKVPHSLKLEDRKALYVTGVSEVDSFDDQNGVIYTDFGELTIRGKNLHVNSLNLESGELNIDGQICSMTYTENKPRSQSIISKIFR